MCYNRAEFGFGSIYVIYIFIEVSYGRIEHK